MFTSCTSELKLNKAAKANAKIIGLHYNLGRNDTNVFGQEMRLLFDSLVNILNSENHKIKFAIAEKNTPSSLNFDFTKVNFKINGRKKSGVVFSNVAKVIGPLLSLRNSGFAVSFPNDYEYYVNNIDFSCALSKDIAAKQSSNLVYKIKLDIEFKDSIMKIKNMRQMVAYHVTVLLYDLINKINN